MYLRDIWKKNTTYVEVDIGDGKTEGEDTGNTQVSNIGHWMKCSPID